MGNNIVLRNVMNLLGDLVIEENNGVDINANSWTNFNISKEQLENYKNQNFNDTLFLIFTKIDETKISLRLGQSQLNFNMENGQYSYESNDKINLTDFFEMCSEKIGSSIVHECNQ